MLKAFSSFNHIFFVANHALCNVLFLYFLQYTGRWIGNDWFFMALGGVIAGTLALIIEHWLDCKFELGPHSRLLFFTRIIALSILFVTLGFTIGYLAYYLRYLLAEGSRITLVKLVYMALISLECFPWIVPFGIVLGFINGVLLQMVHIFPRAGKTV